MAVSVKLAGSGSEKDGPLVARRRGVVVRGVMTVDETPWRKRCTTGVSNGA